MIAYFGGVLFVSAMIPGRAESCGVGMLDVFVGGMQIVVPFYIIVTAEDPAVTLNASGIFLFGFARLSTSASRTGAGSTPAGSDGTARGLLSSRSCTHS